MSQGITSLATREQEMSSFSPVIGNTGYRSEVVVNLNPLAAFPAGSWSVGYEVPRPADRHNP